jgi:phenylalanyl-tRNA synthetase beta chain
MKISLNWLNNYISTSKSLSEITDALTNIGLEVEGTESIESIKED